MGPSVFRRAGVGMCGGFVWASNLKYKYKIKSNAPILGGPLCKQIYDYITESVPISISITIQQRLFIYAKRTTENIPSACVFLLRVYSSSGLLV